MKSKMQDRRLSRIFAQCAGIVVTMSITSVAVGIAGYGGWEFGNLLFGGSDELAQHFQMGKLTLFDRVEGLTRANLVILPPLFAGVASIFAGKRGIGPAIRAANATVTALHYVLRVKGQSSGPS